jgi:hypothetical protein
MRPFALRLFALAALLVAALAPAIAAAQVVVLDAEVVLAEKPRGRGGWDAPAAVMPADQAALNSELAGILQSQPPLLPTRIGLPSQATLDVTAYPTMNRRTGLPCVGCRNPCRSFRYTYARPDRGAVTVEGQRCRRPNGRWVAFAPDTVIGERPAAPGAPTAQAMRRAERPALPPPLPPSRPGDGSRTIAGTDVGNGVGNGAPAPWDPPLTPQPGASAGAAGQFDTAPDLQTDEDYGQDAGPDLAAASPDVGVTGTLPERPAGDAEGPLVLSPQLPPDVAAPDVATQDLPPLAATPDATAPTDEPAPATPAEQEVAAAPAAPDEQDAAGPEAARQETAADLPPEPAAAPEQPAETEAAVPPAPDPAVETQTARVVMPFGGNQPAPDDAIAVEAALDPDVVRMLRMLRYLDSETSSEPSAEAYQAAVSDFASDERFALPLSNSALREKLETAVDRLAALSSCPATGVAGGFGVCLTAQQ